MRFLVERWPKKITTECNNKSKQQIDQCKYLQFKLFLYEHCHGKALLLIESRNELKVLFWNGKETPWRRTNNSYYSESHRASFQEAPILNLWVPDVSMGQCLAFISSPFAVTVDQVLITAAKKLHIPYINLDTIKEKNAEFLKFSSIKMQPIYLYNSEIRTAHNCTTLKRFVKTLMKFLFSSDIFIYHGKCPS